MDNLSALWAALPAIGDGVLITLQLTVGGALLAFVVAVALGLSARADNVVVRGAARVIVEFFRGTSLVVQLFFLFFVLPQLGVTISPIVCGIVGLGLNYGAYGAEVIRGSINAVPTGQWEAATALSMTRTRRMLRVVFPQAWALMIPSLTNLLIQLLKGTAIVGFITIADLTVELDRLRIQTDTFFYGVVGLILYFVLAYALTLMMNALEVRAKHKLGRGESLAATLRFRAPVTRGRTAA